MEVRDKGKIEAARAAYEWLDNIDMYAAVPRRSANGAPVARMTHEQVEKLVEFGVVEETTRARVLGWVHMFLRLELAKRRYRPIKFTRDVNDACGKDTIPPAVFPLKPELIYFVHKGKYFLALDFAAYFDQFRYCKAIRDLLCFRSGGKFYRLRNLAMGQRHSVGIAEATTEVLLDFPEARCFSDSVIDNVIFIGDTAEDVLHDARIFVERVKQVGGTLNEDVNNLEQYVVESGDWCGVHLDLKNKSVCLMEKSVTKTELSWSLKERWTWRGFAAHVGLLFWAWGIIELPMAEFFPLLAFISRVGTHLQQHEEDWDKPAQIWNSAWPVLARWTQLVLARVLLRSGWCAPTRAAGAGATSL